MGSRPIVTNAGNSDSEIHTRIRKVNSAFKRLNHVYTDCGETSYIGLHIT